MSPAAQWVLGRSRTIRPTGVVEESHKIGLSSLVRAGLKAGTKGCPGLCRDHGELL